MAHRCKAHHEFFIIYISSFSSSSSLNARKETCIIAKLASSVLFNIISFELCHLSHSSHHRDR